MRKLRKMFFWMLYLIALFVILVSHYFMLETILEPFFGAYNDGRGLENTLSYAVYQFFAGGVTEMIALGITSLIVLASLPVMLRNKSVQIAETLLALTGYYILMGIFVSQARQLSWQILPTVQGAQSPQQIMQTYGYHHSVLPALAMIAVLTVYFIVQKRINQQLQDKAKQKGILQGTSTSDEANEARLQRLTETTARPQQDLPNDTITAQASEM